MRSAGGKRQPEEGATPGGRSRLPEALRLGQELPLMDLGQQLHQAGRPIGHPFHVVWLLDRATRLVVEAGPAVGPCHGRCGDKDDQGEDDDQQLHGDAPL